MKWKEGEGITLFLKPSGYTGTKPRGGEPGSNGLHFDGQGRLVLCQHGDRRIARLKPDNKSFETLADKYDGKRFNSPNDAVFKSNGDLYFTDPPYGLEGLNDDPAKELKFNGVYRLAKDGTVTLLTKEMTFPNGIGFSPDEKTLYVAQSDPEGADLEGVRREAGWHARLVACLRRRDRLGRSRTQGFARRFEGGSKRKRLCHRTRRRTRLRSRRCAPGHDRHRRGDGQLRLGRRWHRAVRLRRHVPGPDQDEHQGDRVLSVAGCERGNSDCWLG